MIKLSNQDRLFLKRQGIDIESALETDDFEKALERIDDAIVENIVTHHDEPDTINRVIAVLGQLRCQSLRKIAAVQARTGHFRLGQRNHPLGKILPENRGYSAPHSRAASSSASAMFCRITRPARPS